MSKKEVNLSKALANAIDLLVNNLGIKRETITDYVLAPLSEKDKQEFLDGVFDEFDDDGNDIID